MISTATRRKPIFTESKQTYHISISSPSRRIIFANRSIKKQDSSPKDHFSKVYQTHQMQLKLADDQNKSQNNYEQDSISSSSIESNEGLDQVRRKLFTSVPMGRISHDQQQDLDDERKGEFLTNSWKKIHFIESDQPIKSIYSISTIYNSKTVLKKYVDTPISHLLQQLNNQQEEQPVYKDYFDLESTEKKQTNFSKQNITHFYSPHVHAQKNKFTNHHQNFLSPQQQKPKKSLAKQIRDLHRELTEKTKAGVKGNDSFNDSLRKENQLLRKQNQRLQQRLLQFQMKNKS